MKAQKTAMFLFGATTLHNNANSTNLKNHFCVYMDQKDGALCFI